MEIIAQAAIGLSRFLHPDYVSAAHDPSQSFTIDFYDGIFTRGEVILTIFSIAGVIILCILLACFISVMRNRS
ncbi:MAG: hypothetical protein CEE42_12675 [Promethearchaeota archaeon Loki_b31]|nr:MAG: hypothetical protein CEE42_12675 [Candidatus Lokiarchaeota archaeon Loki_b31]